MTGPNRKLVATSVTKFRDKLNSADSVSDGPALSLKQRQLRSRIDRGPSASLWTSQMTVPAPTNGALRDIVVAAVEALGNREWSLPSLQASSVRAEWVAVKSDPRATVKDTQGDIQKDRYVALTRDVISSETIIYVHGGAFW